MWSSTDHVTPVTGLSPTVTISKNGGAFGAPAGAVTEISDGWYKVAGNATDSNTLGSLILHATGTGADPVDALYEVVAFDPQITSLGLVLAKTTNITGLNDIAATAIVSGGAITTSAGAGLATVSSIQSGAITAAAIAANAITATTLAAGTITAAKFAASAIDATAIAAGAIVTASFAAGTTLPRVTLVDTATTLTNSSSLTASQIRDAVGLETANLDTQFDSIHLTDAKFLGMITLNGSVYKFTENALEEAGAGETNDPSNITVPSYAPVDIRLLDSLNDKVSEINAAILDPYDSIDGEEMTIEDLSGTFYSREPNDSVAAVVITNLNTNVVYVREAGVIVSALSLNETWESPLRGSLLIEAFCDTGLTSDISVANYLR